jgi:hypothetical protein
MSANFAEPEADQDTDAAVAAQAGPNLSGKTNPTPGFFPTIVTPQRLARSLLKAEVS